MNKLKQKGAPELPFTGERFTPEIQGNILIEHYHRYLFAKQFIAGKTVLDIASGEGFGSDLLSKSAKKVFGIDISTQAIDHARKKYSSENLEFLVGECAHIPLPDHSVDVIVSFETIEHHDQHEQSMQEFSRVLKDDGILVISSPDKKVYSDERKFNNEYHVKELYLDEFKELISGHFRHVNIYHQKILFGSVLIQERTGHFSENYLYQDNAFHSTRDGIFSALYHIAVASNQPSIEADSSILEQPINDSEIIMDWNNVMAARDRDVDELRKNCEALGEQINHYERQIANHQTQVNNYERQIANHQTQVNNYERQIANHSSSIQFYQEQLRRQRGIALKLFHFLRGKLRYILIRYFPRLADLYRRYRMRSIQDVNTGVPVPASSPESGTDKESVLILTPPHTRFLAKMMAAKLQAHGLKTDVSSTFNGEDSHHLYVILCAQVFSRLPPMEKTIVYQLEQSINSRWFTDEYVNTLKACRFIMEYKTENIDFLVEKGIDHDKIFYLPIGGSLENEYKDNRKKPRKQYDFIFYGDSLSSERRRIFLDELSKRYRVMICNDLFADELYELIRNSRCVVNIHYYENALLETPRIFEALSLGVPVLSENSIDGGQYPELTESVLFFRYGSVDDMLQKAEMMLDQIEHYSTAVAQTVKKSEHRFEFMFNRALAGMNVIDKSVLLKNPVYIERHDPGMTDVIALSLPETTARRQSCLNEKGLPPAFGIFDGFRFKPGWMACAYGYKALAQHFLKTDLEMVTVFEDDAFLRVSDLSQYHLVREYLMQRKAPWDLFVGVIADIHPETKIIDVEEWNGHTFLTLDKMTGMVFNIYNRNGLKYIANWNDHDADVFKNTIDRHLESITEIKAVVAIPFIAGHKEELTSTLWGIQNVEYNNLIVSSEKKLTSLLETYRTSNSIPPS